MRLNIHGSPLCLGLYVRWFQAIKMHLAICLKLGYSAWWPKSFCFRDFPFYILVSVFSQLSYCLLPAPLISAGTDWVMVYIILSLFHAHTWFLCTPGGQGLCFFPLSFCTSKHLAQRCPHRVYLAAGATLFTVESAISLRLMAHSQGQSSAFECFNFG